MSGLACILIAVAGPPLVEGRVGERGGAGAAAAQVTLVQGERTQVVLTSSDGTYRLRAFEGDGVLTVKLPQGWAAGGSLSRAFGPALRGDVIRADFDVVARRVLRGRLLVGGVPFADARIAAGKLSARTDPRGLFVLEGLPAGLVEVHVEAPPLSGRVELPAGPADVSRDVGMRVPEVEALGVRRVPQDPARRTLKDWIAAKPMSKQYVAAVERLAALANLDTGFRLVMVVRGREVARGAVAAAMLERYLTGPASVPRERLLFGVTELARPGHLELILARMNEPEIR
ncbi:MAG TPA: hypothetical protein VFE90_20640 [Myxococcales bacterium]|nr:hypothetical protein [Myxococcales bacterium]